MSMRTRSLRTELLSLLLDSYERSASYGRPAPWPRDVIVRLDPKAFPEAFAADGRELRASLMFAASDLESSGCARLVHHARGPLRGEAEQIRLGPDHIERAYAEASKLGYEPLAVGLSRVAAGARELAVGETPSWMRAFLEKLVEALRRADASALGMSRERFKRDWRDLIHSLRAATVLASGISPAWERMISERIFSDSKLLGKIRSQVISILIRADPRWQGIPPDEATDLLEAYGVRRKPGLIRCAGSARLRVGSRVYELADFAPAAHLPEAWAEAWVAGVADSRVSMVTTVENEYPFLSYIEESGGPPNLERSQELVVYTAGFPSPTLTEALAHLGHARPDISYRHWGDADVGGIRIWWLLRTRLGKEVELFRTTADWVRQEAVRGGRPLSGAESKALELFRTDLNVESAGDAAAARALIAALLEFRIKLEQERY